MELMQNILLLFSCLMLIFLAVRAGMKRSIPGIPAMFAMVVFFIVWIIGDLIEANAANFACMLFGRNIQQIGVFFTPLCTLYFSIDYTANNKMRVFAYAMTAVQTISLFLIFTDQYTHIMRKEIVVQNAFFGQTLAVNSTRIGSVLVSFNFCLPLIALIILSLFARTVSAKLRRPLWMIIISISLTLFVAVLQSVFLCNAGINIPIPILNLPCVVLMFYAVLRGGFLRLAPTVFNKVFEVIDQGIIVLNAGGLVTEYNGRANELIGAVSNIHPLKMGSDILTYLLDKPMLSGRKYFRPEDLPKELSNPQRNLYISLTCHTLDAPNGKPFGYVLVLTDITSLKKRAEIDPLTGVYNREGLANTFADIKNQADSPYSVSAMIIDLDRFKDINDTYGHFAGDNVLLDFVKAAQTVLPGDYLFGRLGGDEFVVLLPVEIQEAFAICERLRQAVEKKKLRYLNNEIPYTISIGVAASNIQDVSLYALLDKADKALYKAKQQGRNKTGI